MAKKKKAKADGLKTVAKVGAVGVGIYLLWDKIIGPKIIGGM